MNDLPLNEKIVWSNQEDLYAFTRETDEVHEIARRESQMKSMRRIR